MLSFNFTRVPKDKIEFSQSVNTNQGDARGIELSQMDLPLLSHRKKHFPQNSTNQHLFWSNLKTTIYDKKFINGENHQQSRPSASC